MAIFDLGFGVELECYLPEGRTMQQAARAVSDRIGQPVNAEAYNHHRRPTWKAVTDASLGNLRGVEFVSPVLRGEAGLTQLEQVCDALTDFGCTVNRSCGYHVHVGVENASVAFWRDIAKLYAIYEPVIDGFMPPSRRASSNMYCRSMTSASIPAIEAATDREGVARAATGLRVLTNESRYYKLNLVAYSRHRTVEFRQHSGTLDARKTRMWTTLCLRMVDASKRGIAFETTQATAPINSAKPGSKAYQIGQMLLRPEGVTRTEIMTAMQWPSVSIPQQAAICGIEFTTQKTGREVRYFARTAQAAAPQMTITVDGLCDLIGANDNEREYFKTRTRNLSGPTEWAA